MQCIVPECTLLPYTTLFRSWKVSMQGEGNEKEIVFHAYIEDGWHLYATDIPSGGPIPTSFSFDDISNMSLKGDRSEEHTSKLQSRFDLVCRLMLENKNIIK